MKLTKFAVLVAGAALVLPSAAVVSTASAGTAPPPCTNRAIAKALNKAGPEDNYKILSKYCKGYWASGAVTIDGQDEGAYLVEDNGGKWKAVSSKRRAKLCQTNNTTLPKKVKKHACVS